MRLTDATVVIRPRSQWEAMDLGIRLARRHAGLLMASWAIITLPLLGLLSALLWSYPSIAVLIFWLLKPAYERLPLYILSQALFGHTPSLSASLRALPGLLKPQLLASLIWRRLSMTRSFDLPVLQLEGLAGQARSQRLVVLGQKGTAGATWLTLVGVHVEMALLFGLFALLYLMLPMQVEIDWSWESLINPDSHQWLWLEHLSNLLYGLLLVIWGPVYAACGFTLYLNRRSELEAWDIELVLRRLRQRVTGSAYALLLLAGLLLSQWPAPALADDMPVQCQPEQLAADHPDAPRLQLQHLDSESARYAIAGLLAEPPFEHTEQVTRWRLGDPQELDEERIKAWAERLKALFDWWERSSGLALVVESLLWGLCLGLLIWLAWRYRQWLQAFGSRLRLPRRSPAEVPPSQLFGLEVSPQSLPQDIPGAVLALWTEQPRAALSLLYRALLSHLLHERQLPLKASHTEGEVLALVQRQQHEPLSQFCQQLTTHWLQLAYGHRLPPADSCQALCAQWRQLFTTEPRP